MDSLHEKALSALNVVPISEAQVREGDIPWSVVFREAKEWLPHAGFLCFAVAEVISEMDDACDDSELSDKAADQLDRMQGYVMALIRPHTTLTGIAWSKVGISLADQPKQVQIDTRTLWAERLAAQFEAAGN